MRLLLIGGGLLLLGLVGSAQAALLDPFAGSNQNPLVAVYGLPPAGPAKVLAPGRGRVELRSLLASSASRSQRSTESVLLDGETTRVTLALAYGLQENLEVGVEVPYLFHQDGFLDALIMDWHDFFHLPQGDRPALPRDRLDYRYQRNGTSLLEVKDETSGFGDLRLLGALQLWQESSGEGEQSLALRASLKLPTGDAAKLTGSGSTDLALWLTGSHQRPAHRWGLFGAAGVLFLSEGDLLPAQQRQIVPFATLGGGWQPWQRLALKLQFDAQGAFYSDSALHELSPSVQLVMGGTLRLAPATELDLSFSEDLLVDSAPDIVFQLVLRRRF